MARGHDIPPPSSPHHSRLIEPWSAMVMDDQDCDHHHPDHPAKHWPSGSIQPETKVFCWNTYPAYPMKRQSWEAYSNTTPQYFTIDNCCKEIDYRFSWASRCSPTDSTICSEACLADHGMHPKTSLAAAPSPSCFGCQFCSTASRKSPMDSSDVVSTTHETCELKGLDFRVLFCFAQIPYLKNISSKLFQTMCKYLFHQRDTSWRTGSDPIWSWNVSPFRGEGIWTKPLPTRAPTCLLSWGCQTTWHSSWIVPREGWRKSRRSPAETVEDSWEPGSGEPKKIDVWLPNIMTCTSNVKNWTV